MGCKLAIAKWDGEFWLSTNFNSLLVNDGGITRVELLGRISPNSVVPDYFDRIALDGEIAVVYAQGLLAMETNKGVLSYIARQTPYRVDLPIVLPGITRYVGDLGLRIQNT